MPRITDVSLEFTIWCSRCVEWRQSVFFANKSLRVQRAALVRHHGWSLISGRVVCDECTKKASSGK